MRSAQRPFHFSDPGQALWVMHVVLVDTAETWALHVRAGHAIVESRPSGAGDAVVATTTPVLQALVARTIGWEQAVERGLVEVRPTRETINFAGPWPR